LRARRSSETITNSRSSKDPKKENFRDVGRDSQFSSVKTRGHPPTNGNWEQEEKGKVKDGPKQKIQRERKRRNAPGGKKKKYSLPIPTGGAIRESKNESSLKKTGGGGGGKDIFSVCRGLLMTEKPWGGE